MALLSCSTISNPQVTVKPSDTIRLVCNGAPIADPIHMLTVVPISVEDKSGQVWVGLTPKHYENLSKNMAAVLKHLKQKNAVIDYYGDCINEYLEEQKTGDG